MTKDAKTRYFNDVSDLETCMDYLVLSGRSWKKLNLPSHLPKIKFLLNPCLLNTQYMFLYLITYQRSKEVFLVYQELVHNMEYLVPHMDPYHF